jgi:signal peptidase I
MKATYNLLAVVIGAMIALLLLGLPLVIRTYRVPSSAMEPALAAGTHIAVHLTRDVQRSDIVAFRYPPKPEPQP